MSDSTLKERALFFIDRRISQLGVQPPSHEAMAERGASYAERRRYETAMEEKHEQNKTERAALEWAREKILEV